jgi:hypothetical protein
MHYYLARKKDIKQKVDEYVVEKKNPKKNQRHSHEAGQVSIMTQTYG